MRHLNQLPRMHRIAWLFCTTVLLGSSIAWAGEIQKCVDVQGKVSYTDKPCPATDKSETLRMAADPPVAPESPAPPLGSAQSAECAAVKQAMRDQTVPVDRLNEHNNRVRTCLRAELQEAMAQAEADERAEAQARRAEIARKSPECQALYTELSALQASLETPDKVNYYIGRQREYERTCR